MKKYILLTLTMSLFACGGGGSSDGSKPDQQATNQANPSTNQTPKTNNQTNPNTNQAPKTDNQSNQNRDISLKAVSNPNKEHIQSMLTDLEKKYAVKFFMENLSGFAWNITYEPADSNDYKNLQDYLLMFDKEFAKYPKVFLQTTKLKNVLIAKSVKIDQQKRSAIPEYVQETLILDFLQANYDKTYQKHVIHHEFYHLIEEELNGDTYYKDPNWAALNQSDFVYGNGGASVHGQSNQYAYTHPKTGFVNLYATTSIEEDKAEIFATQFVSSEYNKLLEWIKTDDVLKQKMVYMQTFLKQTDPAFTQKYWTDLHNNDDT